jgi:coatomer subunit beta'
MEKTKEVEVHTDFIRSIIVHPKDPYVLTSSDDGTILLWDLDKGFTLVRSYEEHKNFVMKIAINPKDINMFASASMDLKVKIWSFSSNNSHLTLEGHTKGVNTVAFCPLNEKPYLASGADDKTIRIWDYTTKHCVFIFEGHEENVASLLFHPELPILISGGEDTSCKFWNLNTFKLEDSKNFGLETIWDFSVAKDTNTVALGCEEGTMVLRMGSDHPLAIFK